MDGGAWYATVHGVIKSQTRLSNFTFHFALVWSSKPPKTENKAQITPVILLSDLCWNLWIYFLYHDSIISCRATQEEQINVWWQKPLLWDKHSAKGSQCSDQYPNRCTSHHHAGHYVIPQWEMVFQTNVTWGKRSILHKLPIQHIQKSGKKKKNKAMKPRLQISLIHPKQSFPWPNLESWMCHYTLQYKDWFFWFAFEGSL